MMNIMTYVIAFLVTIPVISTIVLYIVFKTIYKHPRKAVHLSLDGTTIFYIFSVNSLFYILFQYYFIVIHLSIWIIILIIIVFYQWKKHTEVNMKKAIKLLWRLSFAIFFILYIVLVLYGIGSRIL